MAKERAPCRLISLAVFFFPHMPMATRYWSRRGSPEDSTMAQDWRNSQLEDVLHCGNSISEN